ncbi:hypothetical protein SmJEL517_g00740 [Synchytrium microbalum]|uniref:Uncharacterized protein n=1 Tax=Synchytrium microbalum TaxID=1806994 RepID=A0A507CIC3_9FUNG|nr:uncharacterized protein SmJEL517_g00740 [Synchytrium microbalum]TPX37445.1 hypothetical protein SmJEL517_g00740 [Synchytrium microbalum]
MKAFDILSLTFGYFLVGLTYGSGPHFIGPSLVEAADTAQNIKRDSGNATAVPSTLTLKTSIGKCWIQGQGGLNVALDVDGHAPAAESGLPTVTLCASIGTKALNFDCSGYNVDTGAPQTVNGAQCSAWTLRDDQPNSGCVFKVSAVDGSAIDDCSQITLSGSATVNNTPVTLFINGNTAEKPVIAAGTNTQPSPAASPSNQPPATGATGAGGTPIPKEVTLNGTFTKCWGTGIGGFGAQLAVDGKGPAHEDGLPTLALCASVGGRVLNFDCKGWNVDTLTPVTLNGGKCAVWSLLDDQPNSGCGFTVSAVDGAPIDDCSQITLSGSASVNNQPVTLVINGQATKAIGVAALTAQASAPAGGNAQPSPDSSPQPAASMTAPPGPPVPQTTGAPAGGGSTTVSLPLQPVDRCNPGGDNHNGSTKRLGFHDVRINGHQPMDDDSTEGLPTITCSFSLPILSLNGEGSAMSNPSVSNGQLTYTMTDDGPNQVWVGNFDTPCDTQTGQEATPIKITTCTCTTKAGTCTATVGG